MQKSWFWLLTVIVVFDDLADRPDRHRVRVLRPLPVQIMQGRRVVGHPVRLREVDGDDEVQLEAAPDVVQEGRVLVTAWSLLSVLAFQVLDFYLDDVDGLEDDRSGVLVLLLLVPFALLPLLLVDHVPLDDLEPLALRHLLQGREELPDEVVVAVVVVVKDLAFELAIPVAVAQLVWGYRHRRPGRVRLVLEIVASVNLRQSRIRFVLNVEFWFTSTYDSVGAVLVDPAQGEERVTLREQILLVQVGAGELERDRVLKPRLLLGVDDQDAGVAGLVAERAERSLEPVLGWDDLGKRALDLAHRILVVGIVWGFGPVENGELQELKRVHRELGGVKAEFEFSRHCVRWARQNKNVNKTKQMLTPTPSCRKMAISDLRFLGFVKV